jgi:hypothetical protein
VFRINLKNKEEKAKKEKTAKDFDKVIEKMGKILENQVKEVLQYLFG